MSSRSAAEALDLDESSSEISALAAREIKELLADEESADSGVHSYEGQRQAEGSADSFLGAAGPVKLQSTGVPSVGSVLHGHGCVPCEYFHRHRLWDPTISKSEKPPDCRMEQDCQYCHIYHEGYNAFKKRARTRRKALAADLHMQAANHTTGAADGRSGPSLHGTLSTKVPGVAAARSTQVFF
eukprot:TRINITY_DN45200_c0_g1_i1.p1 TRINITY_DN45200_c0_g1~~TRINITY_DN45200_c0_g1_i1.p1  ORF type:complete len:201 (+),score=33.06 TRINITY_DN45200_c0_g1_i1:52-603(+)